MVGKYKDLIGQRFGRLIVVEYAGIDKNKKTLWKCRCDCGNEKIVFGYHLTAGDIVSCGCYNRQQSSERMKNNQITKTHGKSRTRLYKVWSNMRERCNNPQHERYARYGGRGISVCKEWNNDFESFYRWAQQNNYDELSGKMECTIDRIDNNLGYSPENCRFVNQLEQANNRCTSRYVEYSGDRKTLAQWARKYGISRYKFYHKTNEQVIDMMEQLDKTEIENGVE